MKVHAQRDRIDAAGGTALFVAFDGPAELRQKLLAGVDLAYPLLVDPERTSYRAWGLRRSSVAGVWLDPRVWWRYAALLVHGEPFRGLGDDTLQLGGDFVIAPDGTVAWARPQRRDDRPPVTELVTRLEDAARLPH